MPRSPLGRSKGVDYLSTALKPDCRVWLILMGFCFGFLLDLLIQRPRVVWLGFVLVLRVRIRAEKRGLAIDSPLPPLFSSLPLFSFSFPLFHLSFGFSLELGLVLGDLGGGFGLHLSSSS